MSPALGSFSNSEDHINGGWVQLAQQGIQQCCIPLPVVTAGHCLDSLETSPSAGPSH